MEDKSHSGAAAPWIALTAVAPIAWGSTYFVTRHLLPADSPIWGAVIGCLPAGILLLLAVRRLPRGAWWWRSAVLGALTVGGLNVLVYVAALRLPTSIAATVMSTSAAAMLLMGWFVLRQRPRLAAVVGAVVGIAGVAVMMAPGFGAIDPWGVAASVGAMLSSSLGFVLTVRWGRGVPPLTMTAWQLTAGGLLLLPFAVLVEGLPPALDPPAAAGFVYVILVATVVAYGGWFTGLQRLPAGTVGLLGLLNPLTGVALGVVVAGEPFGVVQALGVALVVTGVALGVGGRRTRSVKVVPPTGIEPATFGTGNQRSIP